LCLRLSRIKSAMLTLKAGSTRYGASRDSRYGRSRDNTAVLCHNDRPRPTFWIVEATWLQVDSSFMLPPPPISIRSSLDCQKRFNKAPCYSTHDIGPTKSEGKTERAVWFKWHQGVVGFHTGHRSRMRLIAPKEPCEGIRCSQRCRTQANLIQRNTDHYYSGTCGCLDAGIRCADSAPRGPGLLWHPAGSHRPASHQTPLPPPCTATLDGVSRDQSILRQFLCSIPHERPPSVGPCKCFPHEFICGVFTPDHLGPS
jgi:hypothetical protein